MQRCADKASQKFLATKQDLGIQLRLEWNIDATKGLVKRVRFSKIPLRSSTPICSLTYQESKAVRKKAHLVKLKGNGCCCLLKGKRSAYFAAIRIQNCDYSD